MIKTVNNGYIVAFIKEGENDSEYDRLVGIFNSVGEPDDGRVWAMKEDETMVQVGIVSEEPEVESDVALREILEVMGVS